MVRTFPAHMTFLDHQSDCESQVVRFFSSASRLLHLRRADTIWRLRRRASSAQDRNRLSEPFAAPLCYELPCTPAGLCPEEVSFGLVATPGLVAACSAEPSTRRSATIRSEGVPFYKAGERDSTWIRFYTGLAGTST